MTLLADCPRPSLASRHRRDCEACRSRFNARQRAKRRAENPSRIGLVVEDYLETLERQWGGGVPMAVLVDAIRERHRHSPDTIRRAVFRMVEASRIVAYRLGDESRYRLNEPGPR